MTVFVFSNNALTTLAGPIATSATSLSLAAGTGVLFPNPGVGQQFSMTLVSQTDSNVREIVYCTARNIDTCTVVRGQEGTSPAAFIAGDAVNNWLTAGQMAAMTQSTQLQQQTGNYAVDTGTANNIIIALNPAPASLAQLTGAPLRVKVAAQNGGTTITVKAGTAIEQSWNGTLIGFGLPTVMTNLITSYAGHYDTNTATTNSAICQLSPELSMASRRF